MCKNIISRLYKCIFVQNISDEKNQMVRINCMEKLTGEEAVDYSWGPTGWENMADEGIWQN
jgi:hypothetical protein